MIICIDKDDIKDKQQIQGAQRHDQMKDSGYAVVGVGDKAYGDTTIKKNKF
jgi:hypothetical protein